MSSAEYAYSLWPFGSYQRGPSEHHYLQQIALPSQIISPNCLADYQAHGASSGLFSARQAWHFKPLINSHFVNCWASYVRAPLLSPKSSQRNARIVCGDCMEWEKCQSWQCSHSRLILGKGLCWTKIFWNSLWVWDNVVHNLQQKLYGHETFTIPVGHCWSSAATLDVIEGPDWRTRSKLQDIW